MADENAIVIERIVNAPVELVWKMWTEPEHFKRWYGPDSFAVPVAEMDVRVGGKRLVCMEMQTPNGVMKIWTTGEYTEIVPNVRLVYTESMADENGNVVEADTDDNNHPATTIVTVRLEDLGKRTKMIMTHTGVPANEGANAGWNQAFGKMENYIKTV